MLKRRIWQQVLLPFMTVNIIMKKKTILNEVENEMKVAIFV